ncbi:MAG: hypothetical protein ACK2UK_05400 [Candidatus Promineifilaceae bacterium]
MADVKWVKIEGRWCELINKDIEILEKRVYPSEVMPDTSAYHILACRCTAAIDCNLAGIPCEHAYNNPGQGAATGND